MPTIEELEQQAAKIKEMADDMERMATAGHNLHEPMKQTAESLVKAIDKTMQTNFDKIIEKMTLQLKDAAKEMQNVRMDRIAADMGNVNTQTVELNKNLQDANTTLMEQMNYVSMVTAGYVGMQAGGAAFNQLNRIITEYQKEKGQMLLEQDQKRLGVFAAMALKLEEIKEKYTGDRPWIDKGMNTGREIHQALENPSQALQKILMSIPGGGIISAILMGQKREADFEAQGNRITQLFDVISGSADQFKPRIISMIKEFRAEGTVTAQEFEAISAQFANHGIHMQDALSASFGGISQQLGWIKDQTKSAQELFNEFGQTASRRAQEINRALTPGATATKDNALELSLAMDKLANVQSGTFSGFIGRGVQEFGNSLHSTTEAVVKYSLAAKDAGMEMMGFMNSTMQATSQLKLQQTQIDSVALATIRLYDSYKQSGMGDQYSQTLAQGGIMQLTGRMSQLDDAKSVWMGRQIAERLLDPTQSALSDEERRKIASGNYTDERNISALRFFHQGGREELTDNGQREYFRIQLEIMKERVLHEGGADRGAQEKAANAIYGLPPEAWYALERLDTGQSGSLAGLSKEEMEGLKKQFQNPMERERDRFNSFERMLEAITIGITQVMNGLLGSAVAWLTRISLQMDRAFFTWDSGKQEELGKDIAWADAVLQASKGDMKNGLRDLGKFASHVGDMKIFQAMNRPEGWDPSQGYIDPEKRAAEVAARKAESDKTKLYEGMQDRLTMYVREKLDGRAEDVGVKVIEQAMKNVQTYGSGNVEAALKNYMNFNPADRAAAEQFRQFLPELDQYGQGVANAQNTVMMGQPKKDGSMEINFTVRIPPNNSGRVADGGTRNSSR